LENIYGPTEGTVYSSKYPLSQWDGIGRIPIGKPLQNIRLHILSKDDRLQPVGVAGELCVAGVGVARGYLNRPQLTAEKFCLRRSPMRPPDSPRKNYLLYPIPPLQHSPIYRTGDLVRWLPDGNIEFLGRMDLQLKIRGFRIEPGEIESQLLKYENIKEVVVLEKKDGRRENSLYAYIISDSELDVAALRNFLSDHLPDYMIPSYYVQLEKLPLTPGGKVDIKVLPESGGKMKSGVEYLAPGNELEKTIANAWEELLKVERVGRNDNFFDLGGTSLDIIRLNNRFKRIFEKDIPVVTMFRYPTVRLFARYLDSTEMQVRSRETVLDRGKVSKKQRLQRRKEIKNE
jgi:tyrocidine synthetase-3